MIKMYKNTETQQRWISKLNSVIATEIEIVALPFHRAVCIGCTIVKRHFLRYSSQNFKILGRNLTRKLTRMNKRISNRPRRFEISPSKLSTKVPMFCALYFRWRQWNGMFPMETSFVALDNSGVLTVKLGRETSLVSYSADKRSNILHT